MRAPGGKAAGGRATWGPQGLGCGGILASAWMVLQLFSSRSVFSNIFYQASVYR